MNNVFDLGDNGLSNVTVYLDLNGNQVKDEVEPATVSDASGVYRFDNLKTERNYKVRLILPQGLEFSSPELANLEVFVFAGQTVPNVDFALATAITEGQSQEGIIRGRVFQDLNGNGTFDDGAGSLLAGKTVFLDQNGDGKWQHPERRVETDAQGNFSIEKLGTQIATVVVETDVGTVQTSPMGSRFTRFDQPLFNTASSFTNPQAIVTGDFNKDTFPDVAVALLAGNQVSIRFGDGKGGFTSAKVDVAVPGSGPIAMYAGYFNAGPDLDLAVVNNFDGQVTIMRDFNGTGFSSIANVKVGEEPLDIAAGNFNGDSAVDLAVVNKAGNTISVLMNDGLGGFTLASTISSGGRVPTAIVPGQFTDDNNDGLINALDSLDLAAINAFPQGVGNNGVVALLRGNGAGGFSLASTVGVGGAPTDAVVADLDLDGFQDLAVTNSTDNSVSILLGRVGGTFQLQTEKLGTAEGTLDIVALDLEQDGDVDLVTGNVKDRNVTIFRNTRLQSAPGSVLRFEPGQNVGVGENQVAERLPLVVEDFDKSGSKDLLVAKGASQSIAVLSNSPIKGSHRVSVSGTETIVGLNFGLANAVLAPTLDPISNPPEFYEDAAADVIPLTGLPEAERVDQRCKLRRPPVLLN